MPSAFWRKAKVWIDWVHPVLGRQRQSTPAKSLTEGKQLAYEKQRAAWRQAENLEPELGPDKMFAERAEAWLAQLPAHYKSKGTAEGYIRQRILPVLGRIPSRAVGHDHVSAVLLWNEKPRQTRVKGKGGKERAFTLKAASPATREKIRAYIHAIFEWLIEDLEVVQGRNPAGGKRLKVKVPKALPRYIPVPELVSLLTHIEVRYRLLFLWQLATGTRRGEALRLTWDDVHLLGRVAHLRHTKTGRERLVPIPRWLVPLLEAEKATERSVYVFPNAKGGAHRHDLKTAEIVRRAAKGAGLVARWDHKCRRKGCLHVEPLPSAQVLDCPKCDFRMQPVAIPRRYLLKDLRSSFGTLVAAETGDLRMVQLILGHTSIRTTEDSYVHAMTAPLLAKTDALKVFDPIAQAVTDLRRQSKETDVEHVQSSEFMQLQPREE